MEIFNMRIYFFVLYFIFCHSVHAETEEGIIKSMKRISAVKLVRRLPVSDGVFLGFDGGEWGGGLFFLDQSGHSTKISDENIGDVIKMEDRVLFFTGTSLKGRVEGSVFEVIKKGESSLASHRIFILKGEPVSIKQTSPMTVNFMVYLGRDEKGDDRYICQQISRGKLSGQKRCAMKLSN
jgi:hypothetical protein